MLRQIQIFTGPDIKDLCMSLGPPASLYMLNIYQSMPLCAHMNDGLVSCLAVASS